MSNNRREKNEAKKLFWIATWPIGLFIGIGFLFLRLIGLIKITGLKNMPPWDRKVILVSNHPSLWEPILLIGLFFPQYLFHPIKASPWSTPDKGNYWDKWYWSIFRSRFIPVPRGDAEGSRQALLQMIRVLRSGGKVIVFPEGGRTSSSSNCLDLPNGIRIRPFKNGFGRIMCTGKYVVVPVFVSGTDKVLPKGSWFPRLFYKVRICVGRPMYSKHIKKPTPEEKIVQCDRAFNAVLECGKRLSELGL